MKKKYLLTGSAVLAAAAILGLASCSSESGGNDRGKGDSKRTGDTHHFVEAPAADTYATDGGELDVLLNYAGTSGVSRAQSSDTIKDPITQSQLTAGKILPTWEAFGKYTRTVIKEATDYTETTDNDVWNYFSTNDIKSKVDSSRFVDLIYNATSNFKNGAAKLTDLSQFINIDNPDQAVMKNFSRYLKDNPAIMKLLQIGSNNEIYYTPYFDGVDDIERMFVMDTALTTKVLDSESGWDTIAKNGGSNPDDNLVKGGFYQPFMDANKVYSSAQSVKVVVGKEVKTVAVIQEDNIIKQQNQLLANGCSGQDLAEQLISYIKAAYKNFFDQGIYTKPSDLYISGSAAYNADELIALMRVVKANPAMLTGDAEAEITTFFPRAVSNNRIENILDFAQIWGIQGLDGEANNFYFGSDGKCHALESTPQSYDALEYLSQIYDEGLIQKEFWAGTADKTGQLDKYFKKITTDAAYGFMMYDFSAATTAANDLEDGVGTPASTRRNGFDSGYECKGITPVIAPLTYWATESNWNHESNILDRTGKTLTRYYESNRAMKTNSWAIPKSSDNKEGAARLMDFMFSELGQMVNNYGPTEYWAVPESEYGDEIDGTFDANKAYVSDDLVLGEKNPIISSYVSLGVVGAGLDYWSYSREVIGSTHGIGNVRPAGVNLQVTNKYGQIGVKNIQNAFTVGNKGVTGDGEALKLATFTKVKEDDGSTKFTWDTCVPSGYANAPKDANNEWNVVTGFWTSAMQNNAGWVNAVSRGHDISISTITINKTGSGTATFSELQAQLDAYNTKCLYGYSRSIGTGEAYVPEYAK